MGIQGVLETSLFLSIYYRYEKGGNTMRLVKFNDTKGRVLEVPLGNLHPTLRSYFCTAAFGKG